MMGEATAMIQSGGFPNPVTHTIARPGELELLREAFKVLSLKATAEADTDTLRKQCEFMLEFGITACSRMTWKEVCAEYVDWAGMHNNTLYQEMAAVLLSADIGQRSIDGNRVICDMLVAHASLIVPDFKP